MGRNHKAHLRYCITKKCTLFEVPMEFARGKLCGACGNKTEYYGQIDYVGRTDDKPPVGYSPTTAAKDYVDLGNSKYALMEGEPEDKAKKGDPITFESDCDVTGCPLVTTGPLVRVPFPLYQKWMFLAKKFPVEWIANLTGKIADDGTINIDADGMYFPNQIATGATVKAEYLSQDKRENTIACIHSHVSMNAQFSSTDFDNFNSDVELVINDRGVIDCMTRTKLKCGEFQRVQSKVDIIEAGDLTKCMKELKSKLTIKEYTKSGLVVLNDSRADEKCVHGILLDRNCNKCDLAYAQPRTETTQGGRGHIYPTDRALPTSYARQGPVLANAYYDDVKAPNPTNQAVKMALRIIDRRIKHEGNVDLRALLDTQQGD